MDRDSVAKEKRSQIMRAVKSYGNKTTEKIVANLLKEIGIKYWASHSSSIKGRPDFIFRKKKVVIFVDGCFWHGCKSCYRRPKTSQIYWDKKVARNISRDKEVRSILRKQCWQLLVIKEHQLKKPLLVKRKLMKYL